jgi:uncharacterized cofD-like protein
MLIMNIVCLGGGHGLSRVLKALKPISSKLTAIVTTTDNGGSTGRLRHASNCVALGDIRRCCLELTVEGSIVRSIFEHRLHGGELEGHSLGNLALLGLLQVTQNPTEAVNQFNQMLGNKEKIYPMSDQVTDLKATMADGSIVLGEVDIDALTDYPEKIELTRKVSAPSGVVSAILDADIIVIGPGSLISSILPPLLVDDIAQAIKVTSACKVFIENIQRENSVARQFSNHQAMDWLEKVVGFQFWDLSLSPEALLELDLHTHDEGETNYHSIDSLSKLFADLGRPITITILDTTRH